jgi:hypothetical protein
MTGVFRARQSAIFADFRNFLFSSFEDSGRDTVLALSRVVIPQEQDCDNRATTSAGR